MVAVDGFGGASGSVSLSWSLTLPVTRPANDMFANAQAITGTSGNLSGSNVNATKEAGEPLHAGNAGGKSVWYSWTAPASGQATIKTAGSSFDTLLGVYRGTSVSALTLVAANDDVSTGVGTSQVTFTAVSGTTYMVAVDGFSTAGGTPAKGNISLTWSSTSGPTNDKFATAQMLSGTSGSATGSNVGATKETGEPTHAGNLGGASVWYSWTAPSTGTLTLNTTGSNFNTLLAVYTGSIVSGLTPVVSNDDASVSATTSQVVFGVTGGITYMIAVDGFNGATGSITVNWSLSSPTTAPPNDLFANAQVISGASGNTTGTNANASKEAGEPNHVGNPGGASVWYSWTAPSDGQLTISLAGSSF